jgi:hypothetical protein
MNMHEFEDNRLEVAQSNATTVPPSEAPTTTPRNETITCPPDGFYWIPHPYDCRRYYICARGDLRLEKCWEDLLFDAEMLDCTFATEAKCYPGATTPKPNI